MAVKTQSNLIICRCKIILSFNKSTGGTTCFGRFGAHVYVDFRLWCFACSFSLSLNTFFNRFVFLFSLFFSGTVCVNWAWQCTEVIVRRMNKNAKRQWKVSWSEWSNCGWQTHTLETVNKCLNFETISFNVFSLSQMQTTKNFVAINWNGR